MIDSGSNSDVGAIRAEARHQPGVTGPHVLPAGKLQLPAAAGKRQRSPYATPRHPLDLRAAATKAAYASSSGLVGTKGPSEFSGTCTDASHPEPLNLKLWHKECEAELQEHLSARRLGSSTGKRQPLSARGPTRHRLLEPLQHITGMSRTTGGQAYSAANAVCAGLPATWPPQSAPSASSLASATETWGSTSAPLPFEERVRISEAINANFEPQVHSVCRGNVCFVMEAPTSCPQNGRARASASCGVLARAAGPGTLCTFFCDAEGQQNRPLGGANGCHPGAFRTRRYRPQPRRDAERQQSAEGWHG